MASYVTFLCVLVTVAVAAHAKPPAWATYQRAETAAQDITKSIGDLKNLLFPRHCGDLMKVGQKTSGVYTLFHRAAGSSGQKVYCDMETDGGGWTVVVRRGQFANGVFYFNRDWKEYASGFGDPSKEYWIGNRALHELTSGDENMTLRVILGNTTEDSQSINYENIKVDNESQKFMVHIGKFLGPQGWDSFSTSDGMMFSTYDEDNDADPSTDCASKYHGGWWYNNCFKANLNGLNLNGNYEGDIGSIDWINHGDLTVYTYSYPSALMLIRPTPSL